MKYSITMPGGGILHTDDVLEVYALAYNDQQDQSIVKGAMLAADNALVAGNVLANSYTDAGLKLADAYGARGTGGLLRSLGLSARYG